MNPICQDTRDRLLESESSASDDASLSAHLAACGECAEFARRARQIRASLSQVSRVAAPRELDGLVVAATQPGSRQERAVGALSSLARLPAPAELVGRALEVLVEGEDRKGGRSSGRSACNRVVNIEAPRRIAPGTFVDVEILKGLPNSLLARPVLLPVPVADPA